MWPWRRRPDPRIRDLLARVEDLEDGLAHLSDRFTRLRGQVTGSFRRAPRPDPVDLDQELLEDPPQLELEDPQLTHTLGAQRRFGKGA